MQFIWGAQRNNASHLVCLQKDSRNRVCQMTQQYFETVSSKNGLWKMDSSLKIQSCIQQTENVEKWLENGKKLSWGWGYPMRTDCITCRQNLTLEDTSKKTILLIDMPCPNKYNKEAKRNEKIRKYYRLCFELREWQKGYMVKVIPTIIR